MKQIRFAAALVAAALVTTTGFAQTDDNLPLTSNYRKQKAVYDELGVSLAEITSVLLHIATPAELLNGSAAKLVPAYVPPPPSNSVSLSEYETPLPHKTQRMISRLEKKALTSYLDNPSDVKLTKFLGLYHVLGAVPRRGQVTGSNVEHAIMASYFLNRAKVLGARERWIGAALKKADGLLGQLASRYSDVDLAETHAAHATFNQAMFYREENRYIAYQALLDDYAVSPNNVYTAFLNNAANLWIGGEAGYDDPTVLYNFVLGSYFSIRAIDLAEQAERAWEQDPVNHSRFRLASIAGGMSVGHRRFLAKLVKDTAAINALDAEHRLWWDVNPLFHMFTIGYTWFEEPALFPEAFDRWEEGFLVIAGRQDLITNKNRPRYTFNNLGMFMGSIDFYLKKGEYDFVQNFWIPQLPNFGFLADWDLGKAVYQQRINNAAAIMALYQDANPANDPVPFNLKRRKWGYNTMTCQACHQVQSHVWSEEDKNTILIAPDDILTIGDVPPHSTTWFGTVPN